MDPATMRADCARCAALCCVALAFDRSPAFAITKPNGTPCPNLAGHRCRIHTERQVRGFSGCVGYDCLGAGQRVTQELFGGRSWRDDASLLGPMTKAFVAMRRVHELIVLLNSAGQKPLLVDERKTLDRLLAALQPSSGWTQHALSAVSEEMEREVRALLKSLRHHYLTEASLPA
jgi:hypothetical protein